ncbi:leucine-rich repeat domain-containing protein [Ruminococcus sp. HUN007]|uniref:leucine-rich repeat domain-containing protein n=1 Tax=Ruminococcus sp. HUN007 TaxID=1514668 RepID=UPI0005D24DF4|nr:leucine-rich repeat domain-containing protein [Ruminococcus sp. HUN007]
MSDNTKQSDVILKSFGDISEKYIAEADPEKKSGGKNKNRIFFICAGYAAAVLLLITANLPERSEDGNFTPVITSITVADSLMAEETSGTSVTPVRVSETTVITENTVCIPVEGTPGTSISTDVTESRDEGIRKNEENNGISADERQNTEPMTEKPDEPKETYIVTESHESRSENSDQYSGAYGKNMNWNYDSGNRTLTISGSGFMEPEDDEIFTDGKRFSWVSDAEHVVVSEGVESIGADTFCKFVSLKTVSLPDSLKKIGSDSFRNCVSLENVIIPSGVTEIETGAFMNCNSLKSVNIPEGIDAIRSETFKGCCSLKTVVIPESTAKIEDNAFQNCLMLREAVIYGHSVSFGSLVFDPQEDNSMLVIKGYEDTREYALQNGLEYEQIED